MQNCAVGLRAGPRGLRSNQVFCEGNVDVLIGGFQLETELEKEMLKKFRGIVLYLAALKSNTCKHMAAI